MEMTKEELEKILNGEMPHPLQLQLDKIQFLLNKITKVAKAQMDGEETSGSMGLPIQLLGEVGRLFTDLTAAIINTYGVPNRKTVPDFISEMLDVLQMDIVHRIGRRPS